MSSVLIQNDEILVIFQYLLENCNDFKITEFCCVLCRLLRKVLAVVQIEKKLGLALLRCCKSSTKAFTQADRKLEIKTVLKYCH